ncbi:hypothetical protein HK102_007195 [Quaeritorhiza haematococci]|nr:hypothetical protein HK102_007195 [Quaeritorhiza haematococci]
MFPELKGKIVLVVGGAGGIGRAVCVEFLKQGSRVICADVNNPALEAFSDEILLSGPPPPEQEEISFPTPPPHLTPHPIGPFVEYLEVVHIDVTDEASVATVCEKIVSEQGGLDVAVNCAGIEGRMRGKVHETPTEVFDQVMSVNCRGAFLCMKHEIRAMLQRPREVKTPTKQMDVDTAAEETGTSTGSSKRSGSESYSVTASARESMASILVEPRPRPHVATTQFVNVTDLYANSTRFLRSVINVASTAGLKGMASFSPYGASKHALIGLSQTAALEYAREQIRVNVWDTSASSSSSTPSRPATSRATASSSSSSSYMTTSRPSSAYPTPTPNRSDVPSTPARSSTAAVTPVTPSPLTSPSHRLSEQQRRQQATPTPSTPVSNLPVLKLTIRTVLTDPALISVESPYNPKVNTVIKRVGGTWSVENKAWTFPRSKHTDLRNALSTDETLIKSHSLNIDDHVLVMASSSSSKVPSRLKPFNISISIRDSHHFDVSFDFDKDGEVRSVVKATRQAWWNQDDKCWTCRREKYDELIHALYSDETISKKYTLEIDRIPSGVLALWRQSISPKNTETEKNRQMMCNRIPKHLMDRLMPFQVEGVLRAISLNNRVLIADEMGLGKTVQALALCAYNRSMWPVLVICPSTLRMTWAAEIKRWLSSSSSAAPRVQILFHRTDEIRREPDDGAGGAGRLPDFVIVSYTLCALGSKDGGSVKGKGKDKGKMKDVGDADSGSSIAEQIRAVGFKVVVCDESHYLKSPQTQRTKTITPIVKAAKCAILLSGTPALSRPIELFPQVNALRSNIFASIFEFGNRYCGPTHNKFVGIIEYKGSTNEKELNWLLNETVMVRRLKKDVLEDMPPKLRQCLYVEVSKSHQATLKSLSNTLQAEKIQLDMLLRDGGSVSRLDARMYKALRGQSRVNLTKMYEKTGLAKVSPVIEYVKELVTETGDSAFGDGDEGRPCKILIFAHHKKVMDELEKAVEKKIKCKYIRIDGTTPQQSRQGLCDRFQNEKETRVALLSITAAGVGLTLNEADLVVFAELYWTPAMLLQGEDRAHRIGRKGTVFVKYMLAPGSIDDILWPMVGRKLDVIGKSLDGSSQSMSATTTTHSSSSSSPSSSNAEETDEETRVVDEFITAIEKGVVQLGSGCLDGDILSRTEAAGVGAGSTGTESDEDGEEGGEGEGGEEEEEEEESGSVKTRGKGAKGKGKGEDGATPVKRSCVIMTDEEEEEEEGGRDAKGKSVATTTTTPTPAKRRRGIVTDEDEDEDENNDEDESEHEYMDLTQVDVKETGMMTRQRKRKMEEDEEKGKGKRVLWSPDPSWLKRRKD